MTEEPRVSVVLPVYNQADHIEKIVKDYLASSRRFERSPRDHSGGECKPRRLSGAVSTLGTVR